MYGMDADLDGLRALSELARRQGAHAGAAQEYVHESCAARSAFQGVLGFFAGTYSSAIDNVTEGLRGTRAGHDNLADGFAASAANYQAADQSAHQSFRNLAQQRGWHVDAFKAPGSGDASVQFGSCVPAPGSPPSPPADGSSVLDDLKAKAQAEAVAQAKGLPNSLTRETVLVDGRHIFKDDLPSSLKADEDTSRVGRANDFLDRVQDPTGLKGALGDANKAAMTQAVDGVGMNNRLGAPDSWARQGKADVHAIPDTYGPGSMADQRGHSYEQNANLHNNVRSVAGWYDQGMGAKKFGEGLLDDPTGGVGASLGETADAVGRVREYGQIADDGERSAVMDWNRR